MKNKEFIYEYWSRTEYGRKMIASNHVSESDLLFLIPNNVKRMHGLPTTRIVGKKKRKQKEQRRKFIFSFSLFDLIEEVIENTLGSTWSQNEFFQQFIDVKNVTHGFQPNFQFDKSKIVNVPTLIKPVRLYIDY
jgi:hypothetical protein